MAGLDNLNSSPMRRQAARLRALETTPAATNTAIGRAGMEVYDGGVIDITNGGLNVTGTATISGTLTGSGTFTWSGPFNQSGVSTFTGNVNLNGPTDINGALTVDGNTTVTGDLDVTGLTTVTGTFNVNGPTTIAGDTTVTGDFNVNGPMKTTGTLSVEGATSLKNNLTVEAGKKILLGGMFLENTGTGGGAIQFPSGSITEGILGMFLTDVGSISIGAPTISLDGLPDISSVTANLYIDGSGRVHRVV